MAPLPYTHSGARIAFYAVLGAFFLLEWRVRMRSRLNPSGSGSDRGSLAVVFLTVGAGIAGGFALAGGTHGAAIRAARWPLFGIGLALGNWAALVALVVLPTAGLVIRIRVEERALLDGLGEPYRRFASTRAHLVPRVW